MTSEEFWKDDPNLFVSYRESYINKSKKDLEMYDYKCWLQGLYIHSGNEVVRTRLSYEISKMLGGKGNAPTKKYFEKPINFSKEETKKEQTREQKKEENIKNYFNDFNFFATMKQRFEDKIKKEG